MIDPKNPQKNESRVPLIALAITVLGQAFYMGSWTSSVNAKLDAASEKIASLQGAVYTKSEARGDFATVEVRVQDLVRRVSDIEGRVRR